MTFVDWTTDTGVKGDAMVDVWEALNEPFDPSDIEWRPGYVPDDGGKGLALAYVTSRGVQSRLDEVVGPQNWKSTQEYVAGQGFICTLAIRIDGEWVEKQDGSDFSNMEAFKGGMSGALKRAAVLWGIGRYLYELGDIWHPVKKAGKGWRLNGKPTLPPKFLPKGSKPAQEQRPAPDPDRKKGRKASMLEKIPSSLLPESLRNLQAAGVTTWANVICLVDQETEAKEWLERMAERAAIADPSHDCFPALRKAEQIRAWIGKGADLDDFRATYQTTDAELFEGEETAA